LFFGVLLPSVNLLIKLLPILTDRPQIIDESFSYNLLSSMSPLGKLILMNCKYKYRQKIPSINLKTLVVGE
jgi:hypothetical protein